MRISDTINSFRSALAVMMTDRQVEAKRQQRQAKSSQGEEEAEGISDVHAADGSLDKYIAAVKRFQEAVNDKEIDQLEELHFVEYLGKMKLAGYSGSYIALQKAALVRYVEYLNRYRKFTAFTAKELKTSVSVKVSKRLPKPINKVQVLDIFEQCETIEDKFMIAMLFYCGLRSHEFVLLERSHYQTAVYEDSDGKPQESRRIVFPGKGDQERVVPLNKTVSDIIDTYFAYRDMKLQRTDWKKVWDYSYSYTYKRVKKLATKAGIGDLVSPHVFRHTFATELLRKKAPVTTIQKLLGHSDIATTMLYTKVYEETAIEAVHLLDDARARVE